MQIKFFLPAFAAVLPLSAAVTFTENVAPIIYQNCVTCHRPGEAAPFSLITYDDVKKRGPLLAAVTKSRYMPPWHAAAGYGEFANERRLTDAQIAAIAQWVEQGMPEGDRARMPKLPQFTEGWQLGTPDLILEMKEPFEIPANGPDIYRSFVLPLKVSEDKWLRAVEFRPTARKAAHHALFGYVRTGSLADFEGKDGKPGFSEMNALTLGLGIQPAFRPTGSLGVWAVGYAATFLPEDHSYALPGNSDFVLQMHFHPTGKTETERSVIGIYFAPKPPERVSRTIGVPAFFGAGAGIDIPAGEKRFTIQDSATLVADVKIYSAFAHAHYIGKDMKATATLPDGSTKPLLWIQDWDFNWQEEYIYKQPIVLPKGTKIDVSIVYDNSGDNPRNPTSPPKRVQWGEESLDEMGTVSFDLITLRKEDEAAFDEEEAAKQRVVLQKAGQNGTIRRYTDHQSRLRVKAGPPPRLQQITLFDRDGNAAAKVGPPGLYMHAAVSPDGSKVAVVRTDTSTGDPDVWVFDVATGKGTQITADANPNATPVWSTDGKYIAYTKTYLQDNYSAIFRKASDGAGEEELLYRPASNTGMFITDWSKDGVLCFWAGKYMYALPVNGDRKAVELFHETYDVRGGRFSPDGKFLAYNSNATGQFQTYVTKYPRTADSTPVNVSNANAAGGIFWRADGKELFYYSLPPNPNVMAVELTMGESLQASTPKALFKEPAPMLGPVQLSNVGTPDGKLFVFVMPVAPTTAAAR